MTKYEPLERWLAEQPGDRLTLRFNEVEGILGSSLPSSSFRHEAHWRGQTLGRPGGAIASAGWRVSSIDWLGQAVTLVKGTSRRPSESEATDATVGSDWQTFQTRARTHFSALFGVELGERSVALGEGAKRFDLVSADGLIVGDAKFYSDSAAASAKLSTITEYVHLLQATNAQRRFLVFSNGLVPKEWLRRWRSVSGGVDFYLLEGDEHELL